jgi:hypothetical protein
MNALIIAVWVIFVWQPVQKQQLEPKPTTQQAQQPPSPSVTPAPITPAPIQAEPKSARQQDSSNSKSGDPLCDRLADAFISNWPVVVVGLLGIVVAWWTLEDIKKQTLNTAHAVAAIDKHANAALLNAKAAINAERPWMLIEYEWRKTEGLEGIGFYAVNKGETPAEIIEAYFEREILACIPDNLPTPPRYKSPIFIPKRGDNLIVKGETWDLNPVPIHAESWIDNSMKRDAVESAREFVYFYGVIIYRDMLHDSTDEAGLHYTRFCFAYDVFLKVLRPTGPQDYRQKK